MATSFSATTETQTQGSDASESNNATTSTSAATSGPSSMLTSPLPEAAGESDANISASSSACPENNNEPASSSGNSVTSASPSKRFSSSGPLDAIADKLATLIKDTVSAGRMSKDEINSCVELDVLRRQCLMLKMSNDMLTIQNQLLDFERKSRQEASSNGPVNVDSSTSANSFRDELYRRIIGVLETEFNCCVCSEVFIEPTVLECGHTFCGTCITQWLQERHQCPICRCYSFRPVKHVEMNNFITKIYLMLSDEIRQKRDQQVRDRQSAVADIARRATVQINNSNNNSAATNPPVHVNNGIPVSSAPSTRFNQFTLGFPYVPGFGSGPPSSSSLRRPTSGAPGTGVTGSSSTASMDPFELNMTAAARLEQRLRNRYGMNQSLRSQFARRRLGPGGRENRTITDLNAEYAQQQRILSRFQEFMRRRQSSDPQIVTPASSNNARPNFPTFASQSESSRATHQGGSTGEDYELVNRSREAALQTLNLASRLAGLDTRANLGNSQGAQGESGGAAAVAAPVSAADANLPLAAAPAVSSSGGGPSASRSAASTGLNPAPFNFIMPPIPTSAPDLSNMDVPGVGVDGPTAPLGSRDLQREFERRPSSWESDLPSLSRRTARPRIPTAAEIMAQLSDFDSDDDADIMPIE